MEKWREDVRQKKRKGVREGGKRIIIEIYIITTIIENVRKLLQCYQSFQSSQWQPRQVFIITMIIEKARKSVQGPRHLLPLLR